MAPAQSAAGGGAYEEVVVLSDENAGEVKHAHAPSDGSTMSDGEAIPRQLCFLDSRGNRIDVSTTNQSREAIALLADRLDQLTQLTHACNADTDVHNFSTRTSTTQQAFLDEVKRFELFRTVIQHEDDLLNQRVSWIILAQSFLMAAFITNTSEDGSGDALKYITACVGLLTVIVTMPAIFAAGRNIELQQKVYFAGMSDERCRELHGHGRNILQGTRDRNRHDAVSMKEEQRERLARGHIFPNMAFRGRGGIPILFTVSLLAVVQVLGWIFLLVAMAKGW